MNSKLLKLSAKYAFHTLREYAPYYCTALKADIIVNREYWNHLVFQKKRDPQDFRERLLTVSLIKEILRIGEISEIRANHFRVEKEIETIPFGVIIKKQNDKYLFLSSFVVYEDYVHKKK